jgi:hypothetical protein
MWKIFHISDRITSQQDNVGGNGLHHCSSEIKLVLNDISHAWLAVRDMSRHLEGRHLEGRHLEGRHLGYNFGILNGK